MSKALKRHKKGAWQYTKLQNTMKTKLIPTLVGKTLMQIYNYFIF